MTLTRRRRTLLAALGLALLVGLGGPVTPVAAATAQAPPDPGAQRVTFGIGPAGPTRADDRPFLGYGLTPGSVVRDHVAVLNQSDVPLTLSVYAGDGLNAEGGGLDITPRAERNTDLGAWVTLGDAAGSGRLDPTSRSVVTVTVPPQSAATGPGTVVVPVRIAVPADAVPGDHVGGIAASLVSKGPNSSSQNIELEQRVVTRVYLRVAGPLEPALAVEVLDTSYAPQGPLGLTGTVALTYRITNEGNTRLGAASEVGVTGPSGAAPRTAEGKVVDELVPGGSAVVTTSVPDVPPLLVGSAEVVVGAQPPPGGAPLDTPPATASARVLLVTWQLAALLLALVATVVALVLRRRRRRRAGPPSLRPDPDGAPDRVSLAANATSE